ncbi:MAG: peptidoglycan glycosyltransferase [Lachnospiraceae bacterium]|nr:peptidoglycan glycosyltransferase [Lachnospiraceae bacterium]
MKTYHRRSILMGFLACCILTFFLIGRLYYLMIGRAEYYGVKVREVQERERSIKAARGKILDANGVELASNKSVSTISVIYNQVKQPEKVIDVLSKELELDREEVAKKVKKRSSREKIKANVDKTIADRIRNMQLEGVMVDEDYRRYYPYSTLASKVIGFTGSDNQGIIGLEVTYEDILRGKDGVIYTLTNAQGVEIKNTAEHRKEPIPGNDLQISIDLNMQMYAQQAAWKVRQEKQAKSVRIIMMNPNNGEIYAMVNEPEFDLNDPFTLVETDDANASTKQNETDKANSMTEQNETDNENVLIQQNETDNTKVMTEKEKNEKRNAMWRNSCISDTYEPGSTFKIITATAALSEHKVTVKDNFFCGGSRRVENRTIRCHKTSGHGAETFREGFMNSCNPVFMEVGERTGVANMFKWYKNLGLFEKTGVDVPGEASSIFHKQENVKAVELATMSFGQSIQITPLQLLRAVASVVNGGTLVTPHFGVRVISEKENRIKSLSYEEKSAKLDEETQSTMKELLEAVVAEGGGNKAYIEGYRIGGKTATSEKLPRGTGKYISSFLGIAPIDDPKVMALILIDEPQGVYYGGTIAAPVIRQVFENILPYMGIELAFKE